MVITGGLSLNTLFFFYCNFFHLSLKSANKVVVVVVVGRGGGWGRWSRNYIRIRDIRGEYPRF